MGLRTRLLVPLALTALPLVALLIYDAVAVRRSERQAVFDRARDEARLAAGQIEAVLEGARRLTWSIARHGGLAQSEQDSCSAQIRALIGDGSFFRSGVIADRSGKVICSWPPFDSSVLEGRNFLFHRAAEDADMIVGTYMRPGPLARHIPLPLIRRLSNQSEFTGVIVLGLDVELLSRHLEDRLVGSNRTISILDREGTVIVHAPEHAKAVGIRMPGKGTPPASGASSGSFVGEDMFGQAMLIGFARAGDLVAWVGYGLDGVEEQINATSRRRALFLLLAALLGLVPAWIFADRFLRQPVHQIVAAVRRHETGEGKANFPRLTSASELDALSRSLERITEQNRQLASQRNVLMHELQHRVMASLQLLASYLHQQSRYADPVTRTQLDSARQRIVAMSAIFRHLYQTELAHTVEFGAFLDLYCRDVMLAHLGQRAPRLEVKTDMMKIPLEQAISLALLTNELISNAIKHAFPPGVTGTIRVSFKALPDGASELIVADNGSGMPPNFDAANSKTLGMALIQRLMKSLSARIWIRSNKDGTEVSVALPPRPPPPA